MKRIKGFTLIELLVVLVIVGILTTVAIPSFQTAVEKSKGAEAKTGLSTIFTAQRIYYAKNQGYGLYANLDDVPSASLAWTFSVWRDATFQEFTATARRMSGPNNKSTITMDQDGTMDGTWPYR